MTSSHSYQLQGVGDRLPGGDPPVPIGVLGIMRLLLKWWFVVGPLAGLALFLAFTQSSDIDPEYTAEASVLLVGSNQRETVDLATGDVFVEDVNPLTNLSTSLNTIATVISVALSDGATREQLANEGLSSDVVVFPQSRNPIVNVEAFDSDRDRATATADRLVEMIQDQLDRRQDELGAPDANRVFAERIDQSTVGGADYGGRNRVLIGFAAVGVGLACASAFLLEGLQQLWRRRKERAAGPGTEIEPSTAGFTVSDAGIESDLSVGIEAGATRYRNRWEFEASRMVATLHLMTGRRPLAERITSETVAAAYENRSDLAGPSLPTWLYQRALQRARTAIQASGASFPVADLEGPAPPELDERLWVSIGGLSPESRTVAALIYVAELPVEQVAEITALPGNRVRSLANEVNRVLQAGATAQDESPQRRVLAPNSRPTSPIAAPRQQPAHQSMLAQHKRTPSVGGVPPSIVDDGSASAQAGPGEPIGEPAVSGDELAGTTNGRMSAASSASSSEATGKEIATDHRDRIGGDASEDGPELPEQNGGESEDVVAAGPPDEPSSSYRASTAANSVPGAVDASTAGAADGSRGDELVADLDLLEDEDNLKL